MRRLIIAVLASVTIPLSAQQVPMDIPNLEAKAVEVVDVTLDGPLLRLAAKFLNGKNNDERAVQDIVSKLEGVYVRHYRFDADAAYDSAVVDRVRKSLTPSWKRIVTVKERMKETSEVYVNTRGEAVIGLVVINAEPREFTIVNIVGPVDLEKLAQLEGHFGIPDISERRKARRQ